MVSVDLSFKTWVQELFFDRKGREANLPLAQSRTHREGSAFACTFLGLSFFFPVSAVEIRPFQLSLPESSFPNVSIVIPPSMPKSAKPMQTTLVQIESDEASLVHPRPLELSAETIHLSHGERPKPKKKTAKELLKESTNYAEILHHFEAKYKIPQGLLSAIAWVESRGQLWAINNLVSSRYCRTQEEAIVYVKQLERTSQPSISIGCMQINWHVHKNQFRSLNEALTPYYNIKFAAKLLVSLRKRFGSWEKAIGWYNPKGNKANQEYINLVCRRLAQRQTQA